MKKSTWASLFWEKALFLGETVLLGTEVKGEQYGYSEYNT